MSSDVLLILISFVTSTITAITGIGGGMILIAIMPGFLPAASIVPIHALVQLFSNTSRALFGWRFLHWEFVLAFIAGSIIGGLVAAGISREINLEYTPLLIAAYILYTVWRPKQVFRKPLKGGFVVIGAIQTGLSMMVGATGPMGQAALLRKGLQRDALVVTGALMTTFTHLIKIILFALLGFSFVNYWQLIAGMSIAVILGALLGTQIRYKVPEAPFHLLLKWVLTLLAIRMIYLTLF
ncbi:MAG: sulfite exporter TauE/SafE family protein [Gammaproteobacteria bacterium]|nr:sulfite exporter TauE/SafE family protein [Gammaproteobacteria bacterium]